VALFDRVRFAVVLLAACSLREPVSPIKPAAPLPADPPVALGTMQIECDALLAALANYRTCENLDKDDVEDIDGWIKVATRNLEAGTKADPEPNARKAIAGACHRATRSIRAANQRCLTSPRPRHLRDKDL
jgi:hypothetical protein